MGDSAAYKTMILDELFMLTLEQVVLDELEDANATDPDVDTLDQLVARIMTRVRSQMEELQ